MSWAAAFRAANEGVPPTGVAGAWTWYFVAAWALGAVTITLFINAQLRQARMSWLGSATLAGIIGAVLAPVIGLSLISPYMTGIAAAGLALCSALQARPRRNRRGDPSSIEPPGAPVAARTRNLVRSLAILSATVSTIGVFYALTGSRWGLPTDATEAMAHGIAVALLAALPLLASAGTLIDARSHVHRLHTWGPLLLIALAVGAVAVAYQGGPAWNRMVGGFAGASALVGAAIAWWLSSRLRGRARITIAVLLGVVFASFLGIVVMPILAFLVPVLSVVFALWGPRRTSTDQVPRSRTAPTVSTT